MATTITAGNATNGGAAVSSDNTGILELKTGTGAGTTALTLDASQNATVAGSASIQGLTVGRGAGNVSTNTAVGASALAANTTGSGNHAFGNGALASNTGANNQSAFGLQALYSSNRTSDNNAGNSAFGYQAAYATTTGQYNSAFGWSALVGNTTGNDNVAVGKWSLKSNTSGSNNVAVGLDSLQANTTASNNTAVGYQAGYGTTTAQYNVFVGSRQGTSGNGEGNTIIGDFAGNARTTATYNTFVGQSSGYLVTTGSKNTIVGSFGGNSVGLDIRTASNNIVLSDGDGGVRYAALAIGNVSTTPVFIGAAPGVGGLYFVTAFNTSGGAQGWWLIGYRLGSITTISSANATGLTVNFSESANTLRIATASGTISVAVTQLTDR